ncbi:MAG: (4Fe-4S)-binding protein [Bacteroidota bacterium]
MAEDTRTYTNGEITVVWKPNLCKHTGVCLRGLPKVFSLRQRPWINMTAASSEEIVQLVDECPSGALTIEGRTPPDLYSGKNPIEVVEVPKGPLIIKGDVVLKDLKGRTSSEHKRMTILCRCGLSNNFPLCDASHVELMKKRTS